MPKSRSQPQGSASATASCCQCGGVLEGDYYCEVCRKEQVIKSTMRLNNKTRLNIDALLKSEAAVNRHSDRDSSFWTLDGTDGCVNSGVKGKFTDYEATLLLHGLKIRRFLYVRDEVRARYDWVVPSPGAGVFHQRSTDDCTPVTKKDVLNLLEKSIEFKPEPHESVNCLFEYLSFINPVDWSVTEPVHISGAEKEGAKEGPETSLVNKLSTKDDALQHITVKIVMNHGWFMVHLYVTEVPSTYVGEAAIGCGRFVALCATVKKGEGVYAYFFEGVVDPLPLFKSELKVMLKLFNSSVVADWSQHGLPGDWSTALVTPTTPDYLARELQCLSQGEVHRFTRFSNMETSPAKKKNLYHCIDVVVKINRLAKSMAARETLTVGGIAINCAADIYPNSALRKLLSDPTRCHLKWCMHKCAAPDNCDFLHALAGTHTAVSLEKAGLRCVVSAQRERNTVDGIAIPDLNQLIDNPGLKSLKKKNTLPSSWCPHGQLCRSPGTCSHLHAKAGTGIAATVANLINERIYAGNIVEGIKVFDDQNLSPGRGRDVYVAWKNALPKHNGDIVETREEVGMFPCWCRHRECLAGSFCEFLHAIEGTPEAQQLSEVCITSVIQPPTFSDDATQIQFQALGGNWIPLSRLVTRTLPEARAEKATEWHQLQWCLNQQQHSPHECPHLHIKGETGFPKFVCEKLRQQLILPILPDPSQVISPSDWIGLAFGASQEENKAWDPAKIPSNMPSLTDDPNNTLRTATKSSDEPSYAQASRGAKPSGKRASTSRRQTPPPMTTECYPTLSELKAQK